jgi:DNA modification methylase
MRNIIVNVKQKLGNKIPNGRYLTHNIDKYPAKMVPHLAHYVIDKVSQRGDTILDPFCGSGTVLLESLIMGRNSIGFDVNPIAVILTKAKTAIYNEAKLEKIINEITRKAKKSKIHNLQYPSWLDYWFSKLTLRQLLILKTLILTEKNKISKTELNVLKAGLIITVRKVSRADPRSPKPFISKKSRKNRVGKHYDAISEYSIIMKEIITASVETRRCASTPLPKTLIRIVDAQKTSKKVKANSIDAIITSPPYLYAQDYYRSTKLELAILGLYDKNTPQELGSLLIGSGRGSIHNVRIDDKYFDIPKIKELRREDIRMAKVVAIYLQQMNRVIKNLFHVLKPNGKCCLIVGDSTINGVTLPVHKWTSIIANEIGFKIYKHEIDIIKNRRLPPKRQGHNSVINCEHLLYFSK